MPTSLATVLLSGRQRDRSHPSATMKMMKTLMMAAALMTFAAAATAEEFPAEPYQFMLAKIAASEARFDDALSLLDKVIQKNPNNSVLMFEKASILIDAGRLDQAESELRKVVASAPDLYDAQRVLGRMLLERAGNDNTKLDEALEHLRAAYKLNPDDLSSGMAASQILLSENRSAEAEKVLAQMLER